MLTGDFSTEKAQASHMGKLVKTAARLTGGDYTEEGKKRRKTNAHGAIVDYSNSHGLCYGVIHSDGVVAWYDADELTENRLRFRDW